MGEMRSSLVMLVTRVSCHVQHWLWEVLVWLLDEEGEKTVKTIGEEHKTVGGDIMGMYLVHIAPAN